MTNPLASVAAWGDLQTFGVWPLAGAPWDQSPAFLAEMRVCAQVADAYQQEQQRKAERGG